MTEQQNLLEESQLALENADLLHGADAVERAITEMSAAITNELEHSNPLILPIMIGGLVLAGRLLPQLNFPLQIDYIHATRYRGETSGSELNWLKKPEKSLKDKTILLVDDILDEGITLAAIIEYCHESGAEKVLTAVLVEKIIEKDKPIKNADFTGLTVPNRYVFGYGMDYHEYHRNSAGIYALKE
ncbi:MAG TPA: hypoxanthine-guanine phosphoribosyltransferase [Thiotrichaceae bacterium]|jgi:hypoxanthine phosphoribosyltransferase|nr:hypoxanthine-guanine phosphoribosyltransferase [Thiotrichaceae bacterium]HIM08225.1 hypoxanthine-guanine phosphoribosyltransferase [Gammaproteobacteria bacterium]